MSETHDTLTISVQITANKGLTDKQWDNIHRVLTQSFEDVITESGKLTSQIGHVHIGSPFGDESGREICV